MRNVLRQAVRAFYMMVMLCITLAGCSERASQKNILMGGDPALATEQQANEIKDEITSLRKEVQELRNEMKKK